MNDRYSLEELEEIHETHNLNMDCDCELCREYRQIMKDFEAIDAFEE
jgi:hypothetical protein